MKFTPSLISQDPLVAAAAAVLTEAKFKFNPAKHEVQVSSKRSGGKFSIAVVDKATNSKVLHRLSHELPMSKEGDDGDAGNARIRDAKRVLGEAVETVDEARINGFEANRSVIIAQDNLKRVKLSFLPTSSLAKITAEEVGPGVKRDFEKITKLLEQVEDIWSDIYMEGSMAYDASINK